MELKKQVTSLELSQKLQELGVTSAGFVFWLRRSSGVHWGEWQLWVNPTPWHDTTSDDNVESISAFTVAEIGEMLRPHLQKDIWLHDDIGEAMKEATYMTNEADARAKMLIYLIENKLIQDVQS